MIEGKQCTIASYVDDNKISHVDPKVVSMIIDKLEERFGKMTVTRGKEHVFLGMNSIRYTEERTAVISMKSYLEEAIEEWLRNGYQAKDSHACHSKAVRGGPTI